MADSKTKDDGSTLSFRPGRPTGAGGGSRLVVLESDGKDSPRGADGPSLQPQWLKSPGPKDAGRSPAGPPGYPGTDKPRWGKDPPPARPFNKDIEWRKPGGSGADWEPEGDPSRPPDNRWRDEEREGGAQARAANGFRDRWQVDKAGEGNKWGAADGAGGHAVDHRRERWGDAGGEIRKWGGNRWDNDRDKEVPPPRNKWGPEPERDGGAPPGPRAPPEDAGFRRAGNDPWRPTGRGRGGADPPPTGFAIPPGGFARGRGRGRAPGFAGPQEQRPPIGAPAGGFVGAFWDHQTPLPEREGVQEQPRAHRYSKETMLEVYRKVRGTARLKKPETTAEVEEIIVKEGGEPLAFIPLDEEDKSYYESIRKGEPIRPPPRNKEAFEAAPTPPKDTLQPGIGRGRGQPRPAAPGIGDEKSGGDDGFFDAPALSAQRGAGGAQFERAAEARFADAERAALPARGRDEHQPWRRNDGPPPRKEDEVRPKEAPKPGDDAPGAKDWRSNRFAEEDRVWRKQAEDKAAAEREKRVAPATPPPKSEEPPHRADQASTWRKDESDKGRAQKPVESAVHLLPDDLLSGGGREEPAPELWETGGEHENDEAHTEGGREPPALYWYKDPQGETQGPFPQEDIEQWLEQGFFTADLPVRRHTLPESAPFVPLGTALPHLKPKTPRMPPGYEHRETEAGRTEVREGTLERGSRPGTGAEADTPYQRAVPDAKAAAAAEHAAWQQNHVAQSQQVPKPQTPEQPPIQLHYPSLQTEPPKLQQQPQFQPPPAEPPFPPHFPGAPDLSFLHGDEPPKPQTPLDQFPLFRGDPQRPAEQPPKTERPPYFPHPAFARPPPQQWPPQEHFLQPPEAPELPPWLAGARDSGQKRPEHPPLLLGESSMPFPQPIMSAEVFAQLGGNHEQYLAYLNEQRELHARFFQQVHLQRQHSGLSQHGEGPAFPAGVPPHLQPPQQAHSLEQVEAEQRQRQREREEAERRARTPLEQPPFLGGPFPPDILPPHMRFPGPEQHGWPPRPPFETPEQKFHQEMMIRQQQHEQNLLRSQSGGVREEARAQPELPPFLQGVLPRERAGGVPPQEQSIPPELVQAVQEGNLPVEALVQYLKSLGVSAGEGGHGQGQEHPAATNGPPAEQRWARGPMPNVERQTMREEHPSRMEPGVEIQGQMPPWGGFQNGEHVSQGLGAPQIPGASQGLVVSQDELRAQEFERMHQEHLEKLRRGAPAPQQPWGAPQSSARQATPPEKGPSMEEPARYHNRFEAPAPKPDGRPQWGPEPQPEPVVVSLSEWNKQPEQLKAGPPVTRLLAQPPKEAPWTVAAAPKEKKSLLQIQMEEAERERAERARLAAEEAARIAAGGYSANQSGASPWGGAGGGSRPKTLKEIQEEEARQAAERNAKVSQAQGGPVWGPSQAQGTSPVGNRMEKQAQLQARDTLAEQVIMNAAAAAPQTPPPGKEEKRKRANEMTPPVRTITAEEEAEFVEAGSGKKGKKKGAKGKQAAAASKPAPTPSPMQSASPWAVEAAATRPSLRQLAAEESAAADDTPPEYSAKSAAGPSLADFLPGLHQEEKPQQAPAWNTNGGGAKRMTLKEIQEAERKEAERRAGQERARQAAMPRPAPTQAPSGAPWQRSTPPNAFFPPAAAQQQPANPPPKAAPAPPQHVDDDDDLFWDYGKDVTITLGNVPKEPAQPAFPTLSGPPMPQAGGNWATPKAPAQSGYKQVAAPMVAGARAPAGAADFPTLAPTGAAATATGAKAKKKGAGAAEPAAPPAFTPATAKAGQEFRRWCEQWTRKLTGQDDLTLLDFCMTLPSASEAGNYISEYWGDKPEVTAFKAEFFKRRSAMPASVLQADFLGGEAVVGDRHAEKTSNATVRAAESTDDAQRSTTASDGAGKKKGKKGKKVVDNSLLGFSVHSSRINMGTIESAADAQ